MKKIILSLCLLVQVMTAQNNYGEFTYPHSGSSILSSGLTSIFAGQPGFVMAGYNPNGAPFNFTIDRTDMGGAFTGSSYEFQKEYTIFADVSGACALPNCTPITTSHGVSIIQTAIASISSRYAVVGAFDEGMYFAFLDFAGTAITNNTFWFPFPAGTNPSTITKPLIKEDPANPGYYYICGSYSNLLYAMKIDYMGAITWSNTYPISGKANDMTVSTSGDPVIVGYTTISNAVPDGFVAILAGLNGTVGASNFKVYDYNNYNQNFSCISRAFGSGTGYIIGGSCDVASGAPRAFNLYVDAGANQVWGNVIYSNADVNASNFMGIIERNGGYGYEYFGVMTSTAGIIVSRMDNNGVPAWTGPTPTVSSRLDEFVYNAPGVNLLATNISTVDPSYGYDDGLHIFGTDNNGITSSPYLAQSYFDGHSGCNTPGFHLSTFGISCTFSAVGLAVNPGLSPCNAIYILDVPSSGKTNYCGPNSSVANSSNFKTIATGVNNEYDKPDFLISTAPQNKLISINFTNCKSVSEVNITNLLGQKLYSLSSIDIGSESSKITCSDFDYQTGVYVIKVNTDNGLISKKFMYVNE